MLARELEILSEMHLRGALTEEQFRLAKYRLLHDPPGRKTAVTYEPLVHGVRESTWLSLLHLSPLAGMFLFPGLGLALPLTMWLTSRHESALADRHGRCVINWLITSVIMTIIAGLLVTVGIGIPLLMVVVALDVAFPVIGFVKARNGVAWTYPLSIEFLRIKRRTSPSAVAASLMPQ